MEKLKNLLKNGERENIEFKEYLSEYHLKTNRLQTLACQMNHRILMGKGKAYYIIGVSDSGKLKGLCRDELERSLFVLKKIALEIGAEISSIEKYKIDGGFVAIVEIVKGRPKEHIVIGTAGHVDHGKSTLVGCLITGKPDDGNGLTRLYLDVLKHEIERGLSADLSFGVLGFKGEKALKLKNPLNKSERAKIVEVSDKIISFVDTVGHEPWLRTTIRGLLGQKIDYGLLVVAADDGVMRTTKEHLGILIAMDLPVLVAITKIDKVQKERVKEVIFQVSKILRSVGRIPIVIKHQKDIDKVARILSEKNIIVPIIATSAVTLEGYDLLEMLLYRLPKRTVSKENFLMYIDRIYKVSGVGTVVSGCIKSGEIRENDEVYIGPFYDGSFKKVRVQSIEMHYYRVDKASSGDIVGIALRGVKAEEIRRGMVISKTLPEAVWEFEAEVIVFTHPTRIKCGYEPVVHVETIGETVIFKEILNKKYLKAGDKGFVRIRFKYNPYFVFPGQKFIFREGRSKGMGKIIKVLKNN